VYKVVIMILNLVLGVSVYVSRAIELSILGRCLVTAPFSFLSRPYKCLQKRFRKTDNGKFWFTWACNTLRM